MSSLLTDNSFQAQLRSRPPCTPALGTALTIPSPLVAQITATSDASFIMIDVEHAPMTPDIVTQMVHAYMTVPTAHYKHVLIRIPSHDVSWIKWALDSGCSGIVIPMVNNVEEMETILDRALYPPKGRRSFGPLYAPFAAVPTAGRAAYATAGQYFERARRGEIAVLPMIESKDGLDNCEAILNLDGVDGVFIGPADLRLALGLSPALDGDEVTFSDALRKITAAARKSGKLIGTMAIGDAVAHKRAAEGMHFLLSSFDYGALMGGYAADLTKAQTAINKVALTAAQRPGEAKGD